MEQYLKLAQSLMAGFTRFIVAQVPRSENRMANAIANLASSVVYPCHVELRLRTYPSIHNAIVHTTENQAGTSWISPISNYLRNGALLEDRSEAVSVQARVTRYALINDILCMRSCFGPYQRCVKLDEAKQIIEQIHDDICDTHIGRVHYVIES